jgi:uncharacterized NAD(P)/FAD-binding protein YdhS
MSLFITQSLGGGTAGAEVFGEFLHRQHAATVHWVANPLSLGRGVAYATCDDRHLLNVGAASMGCSNLATS